MRRPPGGLTGGVEPAFHRPYTAPLRWRLLHELRWKLVLARLAVSILAVLVTVAIVPGISIDGRLWFWAVVLGAVFGVLNGVVKPILQVVAFGYLFRSYGLVLIVINIAAFWLLELLVSPLDVDGAVSLLAGSVVIALVVTVLETLVGINWPIIEPAAGRSSAEAD